MNRYLTGSTGGLLLIVLLSTSVLIPPPSSSTPIAIEQPLEVMVEQKGGIPLIQTNGPSDGFISGLAVDPRNANIVYAAYYKSLNGGRSWSKSGFPRGINKLVINPYNPDIIYGGALIGDERGGVYKSVDGGETVTQVLIPQIDQLIQVTAMALHPENPDILYVGCVDGKLFLTEDGGDHWTDLSSALGVDVPISSIQINPQNPREIFIGTAAWFMNPSLPDEKFRGVYRSRDGGRTWEQLNNELKHYGISDLKIAPSNPQVMYAIGTRTKPFRKAVMLKTTDGGNTWKEVLQFHSALVGALAVHPQDEDFVITMAAGSVYRTVDGGKSWQTFAWPRIEYVFYTHDILVVPDQPSLIYATTYRRGVIRSEDGGKNWNWAGKGMVDATVSALTVHPQNRNYVLAGDYGSSIQISKDGGKHWERRYLDISEQQFYSVEVDPQDPNVFYIAVSAGHSNSGLPGEFGYFPQSGVYKTTDGGLTWERISEGLEWEGNPLQVYTITVHPENPRILFAGTQKEGVYRSMDGGRSWQEINQGITEEFGFFDPFLLPHEVEACQEKLQRNPQEGRSCYAYATRVSMKLAVNPHNPNEIWYLTLAGAFRSRDLGNTWEWVSDVFKGIHLHFIDFDPEDPNIIYLGSHRSGISEEGHEIDSAHGLYISRDGGNTWSQVGPDGPGEGFSIRAITVSRANPQNVYVGTLDGGLFFSRDKGRTWSLAQMGFPGVDTLALDSEGKVIYVGTRDHGVWRGLTEYDPTSPPQLSITGVYLPQVIGVNQPVSVDVVVDNLGGQEGTLEVSLKVDGGVIDQKQVRVKPQDVETVTFEITFREAGSYMVAVNDLPGQPLTVLPEPIGVDLVIKQVELNPANPYQNGPVQITAWVENQGNTDLRGLFEVSLAMDGQALEVLRAPETTQPVLQKGQSVKVHFNVLIPEGSDHILTLQVDPAGQVNELNEENNVWEQAFNTAFPSVLFSEDFESGGTIWTHTGDWQILPQGQGHVLAVKGEASFSLPHLAVADFVLEFDVKLIKGCYAIQARQETYEVAFCEASSTGAFGPLVTSNPSWITVALHRQGERLNPPPPGYVTIGRRDDTMWLSHEDWHHVQIVMSGEIVQIYADGHPWVIAEDPDPFLGAGTLEFSLFQAPRPDVVSEALFDNIRIIALGQATPPSLPRADLSLGNIQWLPEVPAPDEEVTLLITVVNVGEVAYEGLPSLAVRLDGQTLPVVPLVLPEGTLEPGGKVQWLARWRATPGEHAITVHVDPEEAVEEEDESNNYRETQIQVRPVPVLFHDDFEQDTTLWQELGGAWRIEEDVAGNHVLRGSGDEGTYLHRAGFSGSDFAIELRFRLLKDGPFLLYFRNNPDGAYVLGIQATSFWIDKVTIQDGEETQVNLGGGPYELTDRLWHTLKFSGEGSRLTLAMDGQTLWEYEDAKAPFLVGGLNLETFPYSDVLIDDIRVCDLRQQEVDLTVTQLVLFPEEPLPGDTVQMTAWISNQGNREIAQPFEVEFLVNGESLRTVVLLSSGERLRAGQKVQAQTVWQAVEGEHTVEVIVDPRGTLQERDRENNRLIRTLTVVQQTVLFESDFESDIGDWVERSDPAWPMNCWKLMEEEGNHFLRATNDGQCDPPLSHLADWSDYALEARFRLTEGAFQLLFRVFGIWERYYIAFINPPNMLLLKQEAGRDVPVQLAEAPWSGDAFWHSLKVVAVGTDLTVAIDGEVLIHYTDVPPIPSGGITFMLISGTVDLDDVRVVDKSPFDLELESVLVSPAEPTPDQLVTLQAVVGLRGTPFPQDSVEVSFAVDDRPLETLPVVPQRGKTRVEVFTTWKAVEGNHTVRVTVDPQNRFIEANETNNTRTVSFTVQRQSVLFFTNFEEDRRSTSLQGVGFRIEEEQGNHYLAMRGNGWVELPDQVGRRISLIGNYELSFRFKIPAGRANADVRSGEHGTYHVNFGENIIGLYKNVNGPVLIEAVEVSPLDDGLWHMLKVSCKDDQISVSLNGKRIIYYVDPSPLLQGAIRLTAFEGTILFVDDLKVAFLKK